MESFVVDYDHTANMHTLDGALAALASLFRSGMPKNLLDVGCGTGTWLSAAQKLGVTEVFGIDGKVLPQESLLVSKELIDNRDLATPFDIGRRFDVALCLEVAEHLPPDSAAGLISSLVAHADAVLFSAACPGQHGQHHVNCQWPSYWQGLFNENGFECDDSVRWQIWDDERIEPWYRQNLFVARRNATNAGREARIKAVIHPRLLRSMCYGMHADAVAVAEAGGRSTAWYLKITANAVIAKLGRKLNRWTARRAI
jgi:SAM-dependent methyltransferase